MDQEAWHIPPVAMDSEWLDGLKTLTVCCQQEGDIPVFSADEVHALLCHLAAREKAIEALLTQIEEMCEKFGNVGRGKT